jgi:hypothetical protein
MCTHPDHEVVTLPDGQVDETHVTTDADLETFHAGGFLTPGRAQYVTTAATRVLTADEVAAMLEDFKRYGPENFKRGER